MTFKKGDTVRLTPNQTAEDEVLALLAYDQVYTVRDVVAEEPPGGPPEHRVSLEGRPILEQWLSRRFELVPIAIPERDDEVEVVLRARVSALLRVDGADDPRTVLYLAGDTPSTGQAIYLYDGRRDGVQSVTVIEPPKPRLDLEALPEKAVVQAPTGEIYVKREVQLRYPWTAVGKGRYHSHEELWVKHGELVELVRKDAS